MITKNRLTHCGRIAENTATGIDVDAKPPAMFTLGDRLTEDETRRMLADHAMLVMQGIASHASAFADDIMFSSAALLHACVGSMLARGGLGQLLRPRLPQRDLALRTVSQVARRPTALLLHRRHPHVRPRRPHHGLGAARRHMSGGRGGRGCSIWDRWSGSYKTYWRIFLLLEVAVLGTLEGVRVVWKAVLLILLAVCDTTMVGSNN
eukprot:COSAG01_NODE_13_length_41723_cov_145.394556_40_plen_207_part_00